MSERKVFDDDRLSQVIQSVSSMTLKDSENEEQKNPCWIPLEVILGRIKDGSVVNKLLTYQETLDSLTKEGVKVPDYPLGDDEAILEDRFLHMTDVLTFLIKRRVEFAKNVLGFNNLESDDKVCCIKGSIMELIVLECARKYDKNTDSILFLKDESYTHRNFHLANFADFSENLFSFCRSMSNLKVGNVEYILLSAIVLFTESKISFNPKLIEKLQSFYTEALKTYLLSNHPFGQNYFELLHVTVCELHALSKKLILLLRENQYMKHLSPLIRELWNFNPIAYYT